MSRRLGLNKSTTLTRAPTSRASFGRGSGHRDSFRATNASRGSTRFHFCSDPPLAGVGKQVVFTLCEAGVIHIRCFRRQQQNHSTATKLVSDTTFASIVELRRGYSAEAEVVKQLSERVREGRCCTSSHGLAGRQHTCCTMCRPYIATSSRHRNGGHLWCGARCLCITIGFVVCCTCAMQPCDPALAIANSPRAMLRGLDVLFSGC